MSTLHFVICLATQDYLKSYSFCHKRFIGIYYSDCSVFDRRQPWSKVLIQDEILIRIISNQFLSLTFLLCRESHVVTDFKENIIS